MAKKNEKTAYETINNFWKDLQRKTTELESLTFKPESNRNEKNPVRQAEFLRLVAASGRSIDSFNEYLSQFRIKAN